MTVSGVVRVDHHQFSLGAVETDTLDTVIEGSLIVLGRGFVTVQTGIAYGPASLSVELHDGSPALSVAGWEMVKEGSITVDEAIHVLTLDGEVVPPFDEPCSTSTPAPTVSGSRHEAETCSGTWTYPNPSSPMR